MQPVAPRARGSTPLLRGGADFVNQQLDRLPAAPVSALKLDLVNFWYLASGSGTKIVVLSVEILRAAVKTGAPIFQRRQKSPSSTPA